MITICGYIGFKNLGDELLLSALLKDIKRIRKDVFIRVLSNSPELTSNMHRIYSINRWDPFSLLVSIFKSDILIFIGGLFQDYTSFFSLYYYLAILALAKFLKKKVIFYGVGVGPFVRNSSQKIFSKLCENVDLLNLRDEYSLKQIYKLKTKQKLFLTADPVFNLSTNEKIYNYELPSEVILCIKSQGLNFKNFLALCQYLRYKLNLKLYLLPLQEKDFMGLLDVIDKSFNITFIKWRNINDIYEILKNKNAVVMSSRLHLLIISACWQIPFIGLNDGSGKIKNFMYEYGLKNLYAEDFNQTIFCLNYLLMNYKYIRDYIKVRTKDYKTRAMINFNLLSIFI